MDKSFDAGLCGAIGTARVLSDLQPSAIHPRGATVAEGSIEIYESEDRRFPPSAAFVAQANARAAAGTPLGKRTKPRGPEFESREPRWRPTARPRAWCPQAAAAARRPRRSNRPTSLGGSELLELRGSELPELRGSEPELWGVSVEPVRSRESELRDGDSASPCYVAAVES